MEEKIRELAIRDPLTAIYNRRYIFERLDEIVAEYGRRGRNFCISLIDLDNFKTVNDTHGHQAGDFVLKEFSGALSSSVRQYDLLGRYGGEEFIIISPSASAQETCAVIERIMVLVRGKKFVFNEKNIRFTFSCGIVDSAEFSAETLSVEALIALADLRLYEAKKAGRDRFVGPK
jgi:diguanylate cyclase (GGDEF)-like protein